MKFLLVILFLVDGAWVEGKASEGWGAMSYETRQACLESKERAEGFHARVLLSRPNAIDKRFECVAEQPESND